MPPILIVITLLIVAIILIAALVAFHNTTRVQKKPKDNNAKVAKSKDIQAEALIESLSDGIIVTNETGNISLINQAAAAMTGWPIEEALNLDVKAIFRILANEKENTMISDEDHPFTKALSTKEKYSETIQIVNRENKHIFVSLVITPVVSQKMEETSGVIAVFRDVSREKSAEEQRADFISTASHEMRTPVAAIEGYLALALNDKVSTIDARAREYIEKAHSSTKHLGQLFQDLLTSAKAEDGRLTSHPSVTEMGSLVEQITDDLRFGAQKKGLGVELITNSNLSNPSEVIDASRGIKTIKPLYYTHVDPDRIREVITNLFDNAVKYTDSGKVTIGITGNDQVVQVSIKDSGSGIPESDIPHLFQKFYRVDNSATRAVGGTGLGLFICQKIVELYNGTIWAESKVGEGSTFFINLPRLSSQKAQALQLKESQTKPLI